MNGLLLLYIICARMHKKLGHLVIVSRDDVMFNTTSGGTIIVKYNMQ